MLCALRPVLGPGHLVATRLPLIRGPWLCVPPSRAVCPLDTLAGATARDRCRRRPTRSCTERRESGQLSDRAGGQSAALAPQKHGARDLDAASAAVHGG